MTDHLSRQLLELIQQVAKLETRMATLDPVPAAVEELATTVAGLPAPRALADVFDDLAQNIDLLNERASELEKALATEDNAPILWDWTNLTPEQADHIYGQLASWVDLVLVGMYGLIAYGGTKEKDELAKIPPCWPQHMDLVAELSWLCQEWTRIYRTPYGLPSKAGEWHDRWLTGLRRRLPDSTARRCITSSAGHVEPRGTGAVPVNRQARQPA